MNRLTELEIKNIDKPISEPVNSRGDGSLYFERQGNTISAYYRYSYKKRGRKIYLDTFKPANSKVPGSTLRKLREMSREYSILKKKQPDLKEYLEYQEQQKVIQQKIKASSGNFKEMLDSYIETLTNERTKNNVFNLFNHDIWEPFPELMQKKPADIDESDIIIILKKVFDRGVTTNGNRLRSYLSASFNHAIKTTNDPLNQNKFFNAQRNPVLNIPKQRQFERTQDRNLSPREVKHLLTHIDRTKGVSITVAQAIKFLFYIGGQRPLQVLRENWSSYDYRRKTLLITDTKGRGSKREYLTPLTPRAFSVLDKLTTQGMPYPFTTYGKSALRVETLLKNIKKYCRQYNVEKFTLRDIRRTCKNLMIDAGVNRETRNLIQNHGLTGVDFKHYDKHDHLPEKVAGMAKYDRFLDGLLNDDIDNIIQLVTVESH
ncbi:MAG: hypothetical protein OQL19_08965 [Gammaproteobacteria bacterium]|nr:hypothetical protein [Gammaproteobacteria bacterium]